MQTLPKGKKALSLFILRIFMVLGVLVAIVFYVTDMPGKSFSGALLPLTDKEQQLSINLKNHIQELASNIGERHIDIKRYGSLVAAASYIEATLITYGYNPRSQPYEVHDKRVRNIEVEVPGTSHAGEIIIIGAHYDTITGTPGANDNASGVSALLELSRLLANTKPERTIRLVFFVNEEPPYFHTSRMGSRVYAARSRQQGERIIAMISLETIGYYTDEPGSQPYPFPLSIFYPDRGNFIAFVSDISSRRLLYQSIAAFRESTEFPSEGISAPRWLTGVDWSDHWSFWQEGYQAIMITDTAVYRYPYYHTKEDTIDKIDFNRLARVVAGIIRTIPVLPQALAFLVESTQGTCPDKRSRTPAISGIETTSWVIPAAARGRLELPRVTRNA
jgi:hypothetical protein